MSRASFVLLVVIGVLCSTTIARNIHQCKPNEEWNSCETSCPPTCSQPRGSEYCSKDCVIGCACKTGFLLHSSGNCVPPSEC